MIPPQHQPFYHQTPSLRWSSPALIASNLFGITCVLPVRLFGFLILLASFSCVSLLIRFLPLRHTRTAFEKALRCWVRMLFQLLSITVRQSGCRSKTAPLIVSNHSSFFDVLTFCWLDPIPAFVAKGSLQAIPLLSLWCRLLSCLFTAGSTTELLAAWLRGSAAHSPVSQLVVFSEGTTSNGKSLLKFRTGAFRHPTVIQPVVLRYRSSPGASPVSLSWESVPLAYLLYRILSSSQHYVTAQWLPEITVDGLDASASAATVRQAMSNASGIPLAPYGIEDKQAYHQDIISGKLGWQHYADEIANGIVLPP